MAEQESTKSVIVALCTNGAIAVAKFAGAAISGSASMLAEGFHSVADTGNEALLLLGIKRAKKPSDSDHPFGYGRERYFWSFVVALALFLIGGLLSVLEGIKKLTGGGAGSGGVLIPLIVLGVAACFEAYSFSVAYRNFAKLRAGRPFFRTLLETKDPSIITVLCEDSAALAGITIAACGIILSGLLHSPVFDAAGSIAIGLLLAGVAGFLARESKSMLIGESVRPEQRRQITELCESHPEVVKVIDLLTIHEAPEDILITVRLCVQPELTGRQIDDVINGIRDDIRQQIDGAKRIFIEPQAA